MGRQAISLRWRRGLQAISPLLATAPAALRQSLKSTAPLLHVRLRGLSCPWRVMALLCRHQQQLEAICQTSSIASRGAGLCLRPGLPTLRQTHPLSLQLRSQPSLGVKLALRLRPQQRLRIWRTSARRQQVRSRKLVRQEDRCREDRSVRTRSLPSRRRCRLRRSRLCTNQLHIPRVLQRHSSRLQATLCPCSPESEVTCQQWRDSCWYRILLF